MKSLKPVVFSLITILLVIVIVQNVEVFMDKKMLRVDLMVWKGQTQPIPLPVYFLAFFVVGLLLSYFNGLAERFKAKRNIENQRETIRNLEEQIRTLKSQSVSEQTLPKEETEETPG